MDRNYQVNQASSSGGTVVVTNNWLAPCFILVDCVLLAGTIVLWYFLEFYGLFDPVERQFYCDDRDIDYPNLNSGDIQDIPPVLLYVVSFLLPFIVILFGEASISMYQFKSDDYSKSEKTVKCCSCHIHPMIRRTLRFGGIHVWGAFLTWILTNVGQLLIGRLTPYFLSACFADDADRPLDCTNLLDGSVCTGDSDDIRDARLSFPSLYASLSAYSAVFTGLYLSYAMQVTLSRLIRPMLALGLLTLSYMVVLTRVALNQSFWTDIIGGYILGTVIAAYLAVVILENFKIKPQYDEYMKHQQRKMERHNIEDNNVQMKSIHNTSALAEPGLVDMPEGEGTNKKSPLPNGNEDVEIGGNHNYAYDGRMDEDVTLTSPL